MFKSIYIEANERFLKQILEMCRNELGEDVNAISINPELKEDSAPNSPQTKPVDKSIDSLRTVETLTSPSSHTGQTEDTIQSKHKTEIDKDYKKGCGEWIEAYYEDGDHTHRDDVECGTLNNLGKPFLCEKCRKEDGGVK